MSDKMCTATEYTDTAIFTPRNGPQMSDKIALLSRSLCLCGEVHRRPHHHRHRPRPCPCPLPILHRRTSNLFNIVLLLNNNGDAKTEKHAIGQHRYRYWLWQRQ
jgi:hypothetical protein